ncbi:hypothetical protein DDQ68_00030 [Hymenobacter nivis]|uniref:Glycosyltransferase 2-like domain-containing protein n=1 Tax=Hymenobacter nivis TaxID=1850093 RepID=A0A2Z3GGP1_9BACT|nr:hypothetical protein DDQ68_00030 [Hymenobacter nivis]
MATMHFSVITPTHDRRALLPEAVASVRASTGAPLDFSFEHLVFDNASHDDTAAYLRTAAAQPGPPLRHWHHSTHQTVGRARNLAIREAAPDAWLVPLDDDDLLLQRALFHYGPKLGLTPAAPGWWPIFCAWTKTCATCRAKTTTPGGSIPPRPCSRPFSGPSISCKATCATTTPSSTKWGATTRNCKWPRT